MFHLQRPSAADIDAFLNGQAARDFSYPSPGMTRTTSSTGFKRDHCRVQLGTGSAVFAAARNALRGWQQFRLGWVEPLPGDTPIATGQCVAVLAHALGLWVLNACRIVYAIDEPARFGFAYGTLPGHVEMGEELFLIEQDARGEVWYEILALSRPRHLLARLGYPYTRLLQARFRRDSSEVMRRSVCRSRSGG